MALELLGSLVVAAVFGLMARALRRWVPASPRWLIPVAASVGLIGTTVYLEYDWFKRVSAELPEGFVVVDAEATGNPMRRWTYLASITTSFAALMVIDCGAGRRTPVIGGVQIDGSGVLTGGEWVVLETRDELQEAACQEG